MLDEARAKTFFGNDMPRHLRVRLNAGDHTPLPLRRASVTEYGRFEYGGLPDRLRTVLCRSRFDYRAIADELLGRLYVSRAGLAAGRPQRSSRSTPKQLTALRSIDVIAGLPPALPTGRARRRRREVTHSRYSRPEPNRVDDAGAAAMPVACEKTQSGGARRPAAAILCSRRPRIGAHTDPMAAG